MRLSGPTLEELSNLLARELHDSVAQTLSTMLIELANFREDQFGRAGVLKQVDLLEQSTRKALAELRQLLVDLRAHEFGEEDLVKLIKRALVERQGRNRTVTFKLQVASDWPELVRASAAMEMFRMVTEAVENATRHSAAKRIEVALGLADQAAVVSITDDGRGLSGRGAFGQSTGLGILGMKERATLLGGFVELDAGPSGLGTRVRLTVPLATLVRPGV